MGAITDVQGIRVGHVQQTGAGWLTGVSVVLPPPGTFGAVDVQGGGPATHESDALDPTTLVPTVDAVVLTGGSAYGLAAAAGVQQWCEQAGRGFAVPGGVVPIVPAAAIFDLGRGGDFAARPGPDMGYAAAVAADAEKDGHDVGRGNVGAGTGALIGGGTYKGGVGTASITLENGVVVGALAVVNALGLPFVAPTASRGPGPGPGPRDPRGLWTPSARSVVPPLDARFRAPTDPAPLEARTGPASLDGPAALPLNTTLVVVATNADLDGAECKRTASASQAGLARALDPSHTLADGDTIFCLATGTVALDRSTAPARQLSLVALQRAAADVVRAAILDGVSNAEAVSTPAGDYGAFGV
ncbi:P1 family peptidase [Arthrobacter ulcerisalmonis]|uniref:P1 family peptidase n=1 Tax=Arthrobacter ulcerisalmonis TaxID=2483813 RepID=UPI000F54BE0E|nr:P1 family peptidase [Arthrobacter ulcerisalmonis]